MAELNIRSILVASDLGPGSDRAVGSAAGLAEHLGAALHVVHAVEIPAAAYGGPTAMVDLQRPVHDARRGLREQLARTVPGAQRVASQQVRVEAPHRAINARAREVEADLIVIGPHQPQAFRGPILGNTADRILRSAAVPILLLPAALPMPLARVLAPYDLSDPARGALDQGLMWAHALGGSPAPDGAATELRVLHVIPRLYRSYDFPFESAVVLPQLQQEITRAVERVGGSGTVGVRSEAVWGNAPAEEILRYAGETGAELLVMGTHGYGALGRALIGSITSRVARGAPCAMLLVPPPLWGIDELEPVIPIDVELSEPSATG